MTPKDGKACTQIEPTDAKEAVEADKAEAGEVSSISARQVERRQSRYTDAAPKTFKPPDPQEEQTEELTWIEVVLEDNDGNPVPGERYRITLPDGSVTEGTLDANGLARVDGIKPGQCQVTFPDYDRDGWEPKS